MKKLFSIAALLLAPVLLSATPVYYTLISISTPSPIIMLSVTAPDFVSSLQAASSTGSWIAGASQFNLCNLGDGVGGGCGTAWFQNISDDSFTGVRLNIYTGGGSPSFYNTYYFSQAVLDGFGSTQSVSGVELIASDCAPAPIPEPSTIGLLGAALVGCFFLKPQLLQRVRKSPVG